ncbi:alpha-N-acetylgalactosaminide alpha-2,6-sialyltransferase 2-like isoform X2 [Branchiostoma lanceolatum]|uniref:alpha-N-acetylgalactosaminide alpha-2,6-sialyltransferase 2-like isoform X2 n=1 Tax=Branchiostoma lanceolatum TaxID=7740 RepID=UPI00345713EA
MWRLQWLFLLCLLMVLGLLSFYLQKSLADVGLALNWAIRTSDTLENKTQVNPKLTISKELAKAERTTKPPQTFNIAQNGETMNGNQTIFELNNFKTDLNGSLVVVTRRYRTDATPNLKPRKIGPRAPSTVSPDKWSPTWFIRDDTYTKSKCPSAIRKSPEKVPDGQKFIPDIAVLMWDEHVNHEEYVRLQQFKSSYGWKDMPYEDIESSLRHLNTSAHRYMFPGRTPDHAGCIRCAVVGNGGIMRGSGKGREIDAHDFVWRVNAAITEGFEDDVGRRTSFYVHSVKSMKRSVSRAHRYGFSHPPRDKDTVYVSISKDRRDYVYLDAAISWKTIRSGENKTHDWLNSSRGYGRFEGTYQPSKGAYMLLTALHTCDVTNAYGFITADHRQYSDHYYEKDFQKFVFYTNHDFKMELKLWDRLDKAGLITLYRGNKTEAVGKNDKRK